MMKIMYLAFLCLMLTSSCDTEHILLDNHEGFVLDKVSNKAISGVEVYTDSTAYDYFQPYLTGDDGYFYASGVVLPHKDKGYLWRRKMSYTLIFRSPGYVSDTIRLSGDSNGVFDTTFLGNIYLMPE